MPQEKKNKRQSKPQNRAHSQRGPGLVNANHYFETGAELTKGQRDVQRRAQGRAQREQGQQNPEQPQP